MSEQKSKCCGAPDHCEEGVCCCEEWHAIKKDKEPPKKRKPVQIATHPSGLYALCDDNTIWGLTPSEDDDHLEWYPLPNMP